MHQRQEEMHRFQVGSTQFGYGSPILQSIICVIMMEGAPIMLEAIIYAAMIAPITCTPYTVCQAGLDNYDGLTQHHYLCGMI